METTTLRWRGLSGVATFMLFPSPKVASGLASVLETSILASGLATVEFWRTDMISCFANYVTSTKGLLFAF